MTGLLATIEGTLPVDNTVRLVAAYVHNNPVPVSELPALIASVHDALAKLENVEPLGTTAPLVPAVPIKKSITPDAIICLENGKKFKSLKRHLAVHHGMTPDQYRQKWRLPADYPMTAPNYAAQRSQLAKAMGLGIKAGGEND